MPCNLAVSIAKAAVREDRLRALLTPAVLKSVVPAYLRQQFSASSLALVFEQDDTVCYRLGTTIITIEKGEVRVDESEGNRALAEKVLAGVSHLLAAAADRLFQQQVQQALQKITTQARVVDVNYEGKTQQAAVFSIKL